MKLRERDVRERLQSVIRAWGRAVVAAALVLTGGCNDAVPEPAGSARAVAATLTATDGGAAGSRGDAAEHGGAIACGVAADGEEFSDLPAPALLMHWEVAEVELLDDPAAFETPSPDSAAETLVGTAVSVRVARRMNGTGLRADGATLRVRLWERVIHRGGVREPLDEGPGVAALPTLRAGDRALMLLGRDAGLASARRVARVWPLDGARRLRGRAMRQAAGATADAVFAALDGERLAVVRSDRGEPDGGAR